MNRKYQEKQLWFIGKGATLSTGILVRVLVKDKLIGAKKIDRGPGGISDHGVL